MSKSVISRSSPVPDKRAKLTREAPEENKFIPVPIIGSWRLPEKHLPRAMEFLRQQLTGSETVITGADSGGAEYDILRLTREISCRYLGVENVADALY